MMCQIQSNFHFKYPPPQVSLKQIPMKEKPAQSNYDNVNEGTRPNNGLPQERCTAGFYIQLIVPQDLFFSAHKNTRSKRTVLLHY